MKRICVLILAVLLTINLNAQLKINESGVAYLNHSFEMLGNDNEFPEIDDECDIKFTINNTGYSVPIGAASIHVVFPNSDFFEYVEIVDNAIGWEVDEIISNTTQYEIIFINNTVIPNGYKDDMIIRGKAVQESMVAFNATSGYFTSNHVYMESNSSAGLWTLDSESIIGYEKSAIIGGGPTLSQALIEFSAQAQNNTSVLNWVVNDENNSLQSFDVYHSTDGADWNKIGHIKADKVSEGKNRYSYTDYNPVFGANYYRIALNNMNADAEFSSVRKVNFGAHQPVNIHIFPNPATQYIQIELPENMKDVSASIVDMNGRTVMTFPITDGQHTADVSQLSRGHYIVIINHNNEVISQKLSILD